MIQNIRPSQTAYFTYAGGRDLGLGIGAGLASLEKTVEMAKKEGKLTKSIRQTLKDIEQHEAAAEGRQAHTEHIDKMSGAEARGTLQAKFYNQEADERRQRARVREEELNQIRRGRTREEEQDAAYRRFIQGFGGGQRPVPLVPAPWGNEEYDRRMNPEPVPGTQLFPSDAAPTNYVPTQGDVGGAMPTQADVLRRLAESGYNPGPGHFYNVLRAFGDKGEEAYRAELTKHLRLQTEAATKKQEHEAEQEAKFQKFMQIMTGETPASFSNDAPDDEAKPERTQADVIRAMSESGYNPGEGHFYNVLRAFTPSSEWNLKKNEVTYFNGVPYVALSPSSRAPLAGQGGGRIPFEKARQIEGYTVIPKDDGGFTYRRNPKAEPDVPMEDFDANKDGKLTGDEWIKWNNAVSSVKSGMGYEGMPVKKTGRAGAGAGATSGQPLSKQLEDWREERRQRSGGRVGVLPP